MGLDIVIKGMDEAFSGSYGRFAGYRQAVAYAYNEEMGEIYSKRFKEFNYKYSDYEIDRYGQLRNPNLDLLLFHSDCDGKLTWKECRAIYKVLITLDEKMKSNIHYDTHKLWIDMLYFCWKRRVTMWFY